MFSQWFQRQRLEWHATNTGSYRVQLAHLGRTQATAAGIDVEARETCTPGTRANGRECLGPSSPGTYGHLVCGELLTYWHGHGMSFDADPAVSSAESLALLGYPLSKEVPFSTPQGTLVVQWFERARLERHTDQCGALGAGGLCTGASYVQSGLLGCAAAGFAPGSRLGG